MLTPAVDFGVGHDWKCLSNLQIQKAVPGKIEATLKIDDSHLNRMKSVHGGLIMTLTDTIGSLVVSSKGMYYSGVSLDISTSFPSTAGKTGDTLHMTGTLVKMGKSMAFTKVEFSTPEGKPVAYGQHTKYVGNVNKEHNVTFSPDGEHEHGVSGSQTTVNSQRNQQEMREQYGKNMHIQGFGYWDQRLLTFDTRAINYILNQAPELYPKAWQSRRMLTRLLGEGVAVTEGEQHKRQRRVINPAFSAAALRRINPIFHSKAEELRNRWLGLLAPATSIAATEDGYTTIDVNHWIGRATFDAFALGAFSLDLNVIQNEDHPLYLAYKRMFDAAFNKGQTLMGFLEIYLPWLTYVPTEVNRQINASKKIILDAGEKLISEKRAALTKGLDAEKGQENGGKDLLSILIKSNLEETTPKHRLSDEELLAQIHSFLFVGSDSVSLSI
ncbi:hypothetical protein FRB90_012275, partial [Tulasnella sp. 427]